MTAAKSACPRNESGWVVGLCALILQTTQACGGTLNAGHDEPRGPLPVDDRNPIVLCNDGFHDNWQGEYAMLFASTGGPALAGIVINDGWPWTSLDDNIAGWQQMVAAARASGLRNIPDPITSPSAALTRPSDGNIESTVPNRSEGAAFILDISKRLSLPFRPLVVVTGGRLTDVADAYLMDPSLPERIVVIASLGATTTDGAAMGIPNGWLDTWADLIVAQRFRYIQVSTYYDKAADVPSSLLSQLPTNAFTSWIQSKQPNIEDTFDQGSILAVALPSVVSGSTRVVQQGMDSDNTPVLLRDPKGPNWLVTEISSALATARFWEMLLDPATFHPTENDAGP